MVIRMRRDWDCSRSQAPLANPPILLETPTGDFGDLEEKEVVLRDEDGKAVCVGRHVIMWARPLDRGTKL